jgi:hypothetical protein
MPYLLEAIWGLIQQLQLPTAVVYATSTYGFFHYLDTQASAQAKKAISGWFKPLEYDKAAVAAAVVEIFDRLYTRPLLGWRAALRSAALTMIITAIFLYEVAGFLVSRDFMVALFLTNIVTDYISLFIVRRYLLVAGNRPVFALVVGPVLGMCVVTLFTVARQLGLFYWDPAPYDLSEELGWMLDTYFYRMMFLSGLAVHLWLPLLGFGLLCVTGLNYLMRAIGGMQWFLKRGNDHPLDAVGWVLAAIVFVGTAVIRLM